MKTRSVDISKPRTLFKYNGKLYETIGYTKDQSVLIQPVKASDYKLCECGRPLPNQQENHILYSPNLQDGITGAYLLQEED